MKTTGIPEGDVVYTTVEMYNDFQKKEKSELEVKTNELKRIKKLKEDKLIELKEYKEVIRKKTNFMYSTIKDITSVSKFEFKNEYQDNEKRSIIIDILLDIANCNNKITQLILETEQDNSKILSRPEHRFLVEEINNQIISLLLEGKKFNMGWHLADIYIKRKRRTIFEKQGRTEPKPIIDWGETNKKKAEILARGGKPFMVLERDEEGNAIKDNGGEKYFVYNTEEYRYFLHWEIHHCKVKNRMAYCLEFNRNLNDTGHKGAVLQLAHYMKENPNAYLNYMNN